MNKKQQAVALLLAAMVLRAEGGSRNEWSRVESLRRGDRIRITKVDSTTVEGRFLEASAEEITVDRGGPIVIQQQEVRAVARPGMSRKKRVLIGAGVGLAAGGFAAAGLAGRSNNEGFFGAANGGAGTGIALGAGAGIGAAIGGLIGRGEQVVYQKAWRR